MKLDSAKIVGFDEMTAEEKVAALLDYEIETPPVNDDEEKRKLKTALSKANSECAEWKKQLREKQTEAERAEAERKEREQAVEEELRMLRRDKTIAGYVNSCLALGYEKELAQRAATAMADNDAAEIMACQQEFLAVKQKELEMAALNKQPTLSVGAPPTSATVEKTAENELRRVMGLPPR